MSIYNIMDYGAVPDTGEVCTEAIQRAIDMCGRGAGRVFRRKTS